VSAGRPYETPRYSKGRVDKAGQRIGTPEQTDEDLEVLENWRASHANILNTFKTLLYNRARHFNVQIAQRLKRRPTIIDKLTREAQMRLSRMHDIAGCRVIFSDLIDLYSFRDEMHEARFDHKRRGVDDDRWNYIDRPKDSGYRGIHDVYTYHVEPKKGRAAEKQPWNGMLVEIQYRTKIQHAWSTAVELAGLVTENNPKFDRGSDDFIEYFRLVSEMFARVFEGGNSCFPNMSDEKLLDGYYEYE
jgi:putative GTP pyrophosphokinase